MKQTQEEIDAEYAKATDDRMIYGTGLIHVDPKTGWVKHISITEINVYSNGIVDANPFLGYKKLK